jgi:ubiquilin
MMNSPEFLQQMSSLMSNPAILEQALAQNPQYASMAPQAREMFQSERFRQMMFVSTFHLSFSYCHTEFSSRSNPETLRGMLQMASMMRGAGLDPLAGPHGGSTFTAPGNPSASPDPHTSTPAPPGSGSTADGTTPAPSLFGPNPFGADPSALLQLLGAGVPSRAPSLSTDARPPEERFQVQLQVRTFSVRYAWFDMWSPFLAITRHGLYQCFPKRARIARDRRKRTFGNRVYPRRRWIVAQETA